MIKKNQGYGICGMKNIYASKSLLGNWVEDNFGQDLVNMGDSRISHRTFETEYSHNHMDPKLMTKKFDGPEVQLESALVVKTKNKEGMPYSLLFGAGDEGRSEDFYKSTAQLSQVTTAKYGLPDKQLERAKARAVVKEKNSAYYKSTETRALNSHQLPSDGVPHCSKGDTAELPNFRRHKPFKSKGFVIEKETPREDAPVE